MIPNSRGSEAAGRGVLVQEEAQNLNSSELCESSALGQDAIFTTQTWSFGELEQHKSVYIRGRSALKVVHYCVWGFSSLWGACRTEGGFVSGVDKFPQLNGNGSISGES